MQYYNTIMLLISKLGNMLPGCSAFSKPVVSGLCAVSVAIALRVITRPRCEHIATQLSLASLGVGCVYFEV